jgi:hypothetical protein
MAKGGKRKGAGRKPTGKVAMLVRVAPEVRARLERDAKRAGRSLSFVAEWHLSDAFRADSTLDKDPTRALYFLIKKLVAGARAEDTKNDHEFNWRTNRFDFEVFRSAVTQLLEWLTPADPIGENPYRNEESPEQMGHRIFDVMRSFLVSHRQLSEMAEVGGKPSKSFYYAFPQAARDLGLTGENK